MNQQSSGVRISYKLAETVLKELRKHKAIDLSLEFVRETEKLVIPTILPEDKITKILANLKENYEFTTLIFMKKEVSPTNLYDAVKDYIPPKFHEFIPKAFDAIGEIVIVDINDKILEYKEEIGSALLSLFPSIKTVYRKASAVSGKLRVREVELLAGEEKCETLHIEHGIKIWTNVCDAYFSPRLGHEHKRVADKVLDQEVIIDLFTGVGPFPLHIAKNVEATIFAVDINKKALKCLEKSMDLNNLKGEIVLVYGDCRLITESLLQADRIIMNLPSKAHEYLDVVCQIIKPGGVIYFYQFVSDEEPELKMKKILEKKLEENNFVIKEVLSFQKIRESAPREIHACLEVSIAPSST
jgi:tRNA (guanine37-N1)-methyltransferase